MQTIKWLFGYREPDKLDHAIAEHENQVREAVEKDRKARTLSQAIINDAGRTMRMVADSWQIGKQEKRD